MRRPNSIGQTDAGCLGDSWEPRRTLAGDNFETPRGALLPPPHLAIQDRPTADGRKAALACLGHVGNWVSDAWRSAAGGRLPALPGVSGFRELDAARGAVACATFRLPKRSGKPDYLPRMSTAYQIVVCGPIVPDPLQTLEPITGPTGPALKNEMMLPAVLDPWASHALYEAANLAKTAPGSKVWLVSLGPKAKLQQVMMTVAQKVPFELVALDGPSSGFADSFETAAAL